MLSAGHGQEGLSVVDRSTGKELGSRSIKLFRPFHLETSGALLTNNTGGILRWPRTDDPAAGVIRFGPPERLSSISHGDEHAASSDGRVIAIPNYNSGAII